MTGGEIRFGEVGEHRCDQGQGEEPRPFSILHLQVPQSPPPHSICRDLYYVAISRARYEATIYTNSRSELPEALNREAIKTAALDIHREQEALHLQRGV